MAGGFLYAMWERLNVRGMCLVGGLLRCVRVEKLCSDAPRSSIRHVLKMYMGDDDVRKALNFK